MSNLKNCIRSVVVSGLAAAALGTTTSPAAAVAASPCQVSGENKAENGDTYEWSLVVTFRSKGLSCAQAKTVLRSCSNNRKVAGWKISTTKTGFRFTSRTNAKRRFNVLPAGGSPLCISEVLGY